MKFTEEFDEKSRILESKKILLKYPSKIPVIVEKREGCEFREIKKKKYLVPRDMLMNQFFFVIRKKIDLSPGHGLFVMVNNKLSSSGDTLGEIYEKEKMDDGFLYMIYTSENTFG